MAERVPEFAHLPSVLGDGNKKLSKRDPQSNLFLHRDRGFIPEGLLNYLALLGWGIADDRDVFSLDEMVATAPEQERLEGWLMSEVEKGASLAGTYPPNAENKARYEAWKSKS